MKRRILYLLLSAALVLQLASPAAQAADKVYFTAVNSYVLPLSDNTMPFWSGGYVYIASTIFTGATRESLGISQIWNSAENRVVLYRGGRSLTFQLSAGCALDNDGYAYYPGAIRRNGVVFVPANTVSRFFDLTYSVIEVSRGSLVWLRQSSYSLSDSLYADAAQYSMDSVYADYIRAKEQTLPAEDPEPDTTDIPSVPNPAEELNGRRIALCLAAGDNASALVDTLESYGARAAFFFTPEQMEQSGDLLRRMTALGHSIGILAAGDPDRAAQQLEAGNDALCRATCGKTRLALVENGGALQTARDLGFRCLQPGLDRSGQPLRSAAGASSLVQRLSARRNDTAVWLGSAATPAGLRSFLSAVQEAGGQCVAFTETERM